jgi:hypothetical protein
MREGMVEKERMREGIGQPHCSSKPAIVCIWLVAVLIVVNVFLAAPAFAEKRVALVIGNATYRNAGTLATPRNDASDMSAALKTLGFQVIEGFDLGKAGMDAKLREFATAANGADAAVFFYAGHSLQLSGVNYLWAVDTAPDSPATATSALIRLDALQIAMQGAKNSLLFIDACREHPLAQNLARAMGPRAGEVGMGLAITAARRNSLISFATFPGNVAAEGAGRNSPFAEALAKRFRAPGGEPLALIANVRDDVVRATGNTQVPWEHSDFAGPVSLTAPAKPAPTPVANAPAPSATWPAPAPSLPPVAPLAEAPAQNAIPAPWRLELRATLGDRGGKGALAVTIADAKPVIMQGHGLSEQTAPLVTKRVEDGAAAMAGVLPGDIILKIDDIAPRNSRDLATRIGERAPGTPVTLEISRLGTGQADLSQWLRSKAELGEADAMYALGLMIQQGVIQGRDGNEAVSWQQKAADAGSTEAKNRLAANAPLPSKDDPDVLEKYRKLAEAGNTAAMYELGAMLAYGQGISADSEGAEYWYRKSAEAGDRAGMYLLAELLAGRFGEAKYEIEALSWYLKLAESGHRDAMYKLSHRFETGKGTAPDLAEAASWAFLALQKGHEDTMRELITEAGVSRTVDFRKELQIRFRGAGLYKGRINGEFGPAFVKSMQDIAGVAQDD